MRTVKQFNEEYTYQLWQDETAAAQQTNSKGRTVRSIIFYSVLIMAVLFAFIYSGNNAGGRKFGPFAYNAVLTSSMQSVYPQGSLITSWAIKPGDPLRAGLENGTDIVFTKQDGTVVVHRIIEIMKNYEDSGQRAFRTQGVDNPSPDSWITYEGNVIGRVTWHIPYAGAALTFVSQNIVWVILIIVVISVLITLLKVVFKKETPQPRQ